MNSRSHHVVTEDDAALQLFKNRCEQARRRKLPNKSAVKSMKADDIQLAKCVQPNRQAAARTLAADSWGKCTAAEEDSDTPDGRSEAKKFSSWGETAMW